MQNTAAKFVQPHTDVEHDPALTMDLLDSPLLDGRLSRLVNGARNLLADTDMRAEQRVWGSWPHAFRAMAHPMARDERGPREMLAIGTADADEVVTFTRRTASGSLDGASAVRA